VIVLYFALFAISLFNIINLPAQTLSEMAPTIFTSLVLSLIGVLIAQWVYQDGEHIKNLEKTLLQLEKRLERK
jgi:hypothetical protein